MKKLNLGTDFFMTLAKLNTKLNRRLDSGLGGISFNELIILYHLSKSEDQKMRRIDLAEKVGLTASGITRLLLPMEKIGLIKRETNERDARVSFVAIAPGGETKLSEGLERAEIFAEDILGKSHDKNIALTTKLINEINKAL